MLPSKEKQEIFRHIFDTEKFDQFTVLLEQESKKALENMEKEQQELSFHLKSLTKQNDVALASFLEAGIPSRSLHFRTLNGSFKKRSKNFWKSIRTVYNNLKTGLLLCILKHIARTISVYWT